MDRSQDFPSHASFSAWETTRTKIRTNPRMQLLYHQETKSLLASHSG